jgi:hypothetical protein
MSNAGKAFKFLDVFNEAGNVSKEIGSIVTFASVMDRREAAYQNCRNWYDGTSGNFYWHTASGQPQDSRPHF